MFVDILVSLVPKVHKELVESVIGISFYNMNAVKTALKLYLINPEHHEIVYHIADSEKQLAGVEKDLRKGKVKAAQRTKQHEKLQELQTTITTKTHKNKGHEEKISEKSSKMFSYLHDVHKTMDLTPLKPAPAQVQKSTTTSAPEKSANDKKPIETKKDDSDAWDAILKKISEGTATTKDLFKVIDKAGRNCGTINDADFSKLANRLGIKLSSHRINEIFAKIKAEKAGASMELSEDEFELAMFYLQAKNLWATMQQMGITPEILAAILIRLIILLLLVFLFIFFGIQAFALGGTFGAVVNSSFPAAAGAGVGKKSDDDTEKMKEENVHKACQKGVEITHSEKL